MNSNNSTFERITPETVTDVRNYFGYFNAKLRAGVRGIDADHLRNMEKKAQDYITRLSLQEKTTAHKKEIRNALATVSQTREMIEDLRISQRKPRKY